MLPREDLKRLLLSIRPSSENLESRRQVVFSGIVPKFDLDKYALNRILDINDRLRNLWDSESDVGYVDLWDYFSSDRSLFANYGLHHNGIGSARFGRVLDEQLRSVLERLKADITQQSERELDEGAAALPEGATEELPAPLN